MVKKRPAGKKETFTSRIASAFATPLPSIILESLDDGTVKEVRRIITSSGLTSEIVTILSCEPGKMLQVPEAVSEAEFHRRYHSQRTPIRVPEPKPQTQSTSGLPSVGKKDQVKKSEKRKTTEFRVGPQIPTDTPITSAEEVKISNSAVGKYLRRVYYRTGQWPSDVEILGKKPQELLDYVTTRVDSTIVDITEDAFLRRLTEPQKEEFLTRKAQVQSLTDAYVSSMEDEAIPPVSPPLGRVKRRPRN